MCPGSLVPVQLGPLLALSYTVHEEREAQNRRDLEDPWETASNRAVSRRVVGGAQGHPNSESHSSSVGSGTAVCACGGLNWSQAPAFGADQDEAPDPETCLSSAGRDLQPGPYLHMAELVSPGGARAGSVPSTRNGLAPEGDTDAGHKPGSSPRRGLKTPSWPRVQLGHTAGIWEAHTHTTQAKEGPRPTVTEHDMQVTILGPAASRHPQPSVLGVRC